VRILRWLLSGLAPVTVAAAQAQIVCPAALPPVPVVQCGNPEFESCSIAVGGVPRHFCIHVPSTLPAEPQLVLALHGGGGMASRAVNWMEQYTEHGVILVAPTALPTGPDCTRKWRHMGAASSAIPNWAAFGNADACPNSIGPWPAGSPNSADLDFLDALLDALDARFAVADRYVLGFSNGAGMALQLYITEPFASRIAGFALIANGITGEKAAAVTGGGGFGPYSANAETRRPVMLIWGSSDKVALPSREWLDLLDAIDSGAVPPPPGCTPPLDSPAKVMLCLNAAPQRPGLAKRTMISRIQTTRDWLVGFNRTFRRAIEGLYPDKGHGDAPFAQQDATLVVRQDYLPRRDGEPVTVLTVLEGSHVVPGVNGDFAPCPSRNCDINAIAEILQFWRAHAGLRMTRN